MKKQWGMCGVMCIVLFGVLLVACCGEVEASNFNASVVFLFPFYKGILELKTTVVFPSKWSWKKVAKKRETTAFVLSGKRGNVFLIFTTFMRGSATLAFSFSFFNPTVPVSLKFANNKWL